MTDNNNAILLAHCPDQKGILANVTHWVLQNNGNIVHLDEHVDSTHDTFLLRVEWSLEGFNLPREEIAAALQNDLAERHHFEWSLHFTDDRPRMAVFVSKLGHCLWDILSRCYSGEWNVEIPLVISNHPDMEGVATQFGCEYHVLPITKENKKEQEAKQMELMARHKIEFVVLARYMQILSDDFTRKYSNRIINIHHSFLPAFAGAKPYHRAFKRGVKIIGATGHYVTADLDEGPIIEQDVARITHKNSIKDLIRKGRDLEKVVLSRAIWLHLNRQVIAYGNRTVVFG